MATFRQQPHSIGQLHQRQRQRLQLTAEWLHLLA
jgi:hypothetical protein